MLKIEVESNSASDASSVLDSDGFCWARSYTSHAEYAFFLAHWNGLFGVREIRNVLKFEDFNWTDFDTCRVAVAFLPVNLHLYDFSSTSGGSMEGDALPHDIEPFLFCYGFSLYKDFKNLLQKCVMSLLVLQYRCQE